MKRKLLIFALFCLGFYVAAILVVAYRYVSPLRITSARPPFLSEATLDGVPVWQSSEPKQAKGVFVLAHGYGGSRGSWTPLAERLVQDGYAVVIPAMPGQDTNPEPNVSFGPAEKATVVRVASAVHAQGAKRIYLGGMSLGGAACWLASEELPYVQGVFTEGAFCRLDYAVDDWFKELGPVATVLLKPARWLSERKLGGDPSTIRPEDSAAKWKGRALIIGGADDTLMPPRHTQALARATRTSPWIIPGSGHVKGQKVALDEYVRRVEGLDP